jgi:serine protease Do
VLEFTTKKQLGELFSILILVFASAIAPQGFAQQQPKGDSQSSSGLTIPVLEPDQTFGATAKDEQDQANLEETLASSHVAVESPAANAAFNAEHTFFSGNAPKTIEELKELERKFAEITERVKPATVNIQIGGSQGSGVVVTRDGYILTAAHVIGQPNQTAMVTFPDNKRFKATTLGVFSRVDSGILKIDEGQADEFPFLEMGLSGELKTGQWVLAIGHPGGIDEKRGLVVRAGRVLSNDPTVIQTDCTLVGGDSGGPLVDLHGEVIGIHSRIGMNLWDNLHVPVDLYSEKWDQMIVGLIIEGRPNLGFSIEGDSTRVENVAKDGPAEKAGMKAGDVIIKMGNQNIVTFDDLQEARKDLLPNMKIQIVVKRDQEDVTLEMVVGRRGN